MKPHSTTINITGGGLKYSLCSSVIELIIPDSILNIGKLQDKVSNRHGHSRGHSKI